MQYSSVCSWATLTKAVDDSIPGVSYEVRTLIMKISYE